MPSVQDSYAIDFLPNSTRLQEVDLRAVTGEPSRCADDAATAVGFLATTDDEPPADGWSWAALNEFGFAGKVGQTMVFPTPDSATAVLVGVGDASEAGPGAFREAGAAFARAIGKKTKACVDFEGRGTAADVQAFVEGALLARYVFDTFTADENTTPFWTELAVAGVDLDNAQVQDTLAKARQYVLATFVARDLTNCPPGHLNPKTFAQVVVEAGERFGFAAEVKELAELEEMGMGGLVGVNRGSTYDARLVELTYTPAMVQEEPKHLALVGKGITFDSGGLSIKGSAHMLEMKMDMGGAAAVVGAFSSLAALQVAAPVRGWLAITDNMISGDSLRVGEVVRARNGKTVEINNTDAEGRLVLMDALSLAAEAKPGLIVDIATLTGAQVVALGTDIAAVLGNDRDAVEAVEEAAVETGEQVWELPLQERYLKIMESEVADIGNANMANRGAGTITAGLFLSQFVGDTPWAHLDIAGPMSASAPDRWLTPGATGFGARLLLNLAVNFADPA